MNMSGRLKQGGIGRVGMETAQFTIADGSHPLFSQIECAHFVEFWLELINL